jgi:hypothetical protein
LLSRGGQSDFLPVEVLFIAWHDDVLLVSFCALLSARHLACFQLHAAQIFIQAIEAFRPEVLVVCDPVGDRLQRFRL